MSLSNADFCASFTQISSMQWWSYLMDRINFLAVCSSCLVHVIWTERPMSKLVLNVKYLLLLSFLTTAKFYNLGHTQGQKSSYLVI